MRSGRNHRGHGECAEERGRNKTGVGAEAGGTFRSEWVRLKASQHDEIHNLKKWKYTWLSQKQMIHREMSEPTCCDGQLKNPSFDRPRSGLITVLCRSPQPRVCSIWAHIAHIWGSVLVMGAARRRPRGHMLEGCRYHGKICPGSTWQHRTASHHPAARSTPSAALLSQVTVGHWALFLDWLWLKVFPILPKSDFV